MSDVVHRCVVVTSWDAVTIVRAREVAVSTFGEAGVTPLLRASTNGYASFFVGPSGSKEGWEEDEAWAEKLAAFVSWLRGRPEDEPVPEWAVLAYGDSLEKPFVHRHPKQKFGAGDDACDVPPEGWWCSRRRGHKGPCAARPGKHPKASA